VGNINAEPGNAIYGSDSKTLAGRAFFNEKILDKTFHVSSTSFFQTNTAQMERVVKDILEHLPSKLGTVIDTYCGGGIFSLFLAGRAEKVLGIEEEAANLLDASANQKTNAVANVEWIKARAEEAIANTPDADLVMLDPPRQGLASEVVQALLEKRPKQIIYLSCDPATLARDCGLLTRGGYAIERVKPFDFFPHTYHIETLVYLKA
jgi:23S rRNA (uracil1939-C5)-methyltransferase